MPLLSENVGEILFEYLPRPLADAMRPLREALEQINLVVPPGSAMQPWPFTAISTVEEASAVSNEVDEQSQQRAIDVHAARVDLLAGMVVMAPTPPAITPIDDLHAIYQSIHTHDFPTVDDLNRKERVTATLSISESTVTTALYSSPVEFIQVVSRQVPVYDQGGNLTGYEYEPYGEHWTLAAYPASAPRPDPAQVAKLFAFLSATSERALRFGLLRAEVMKGQGRLADCIVEYRRLLDVLPVGLAAERKLVALECASAQLALADRSYRAVRDPGSTERDGIVGLYGAALATVQRPDLGIDPTDPERERIEFHTKVQIAKVRASLNVLGYRDSSPGLGT